MTGRIVVVGAGQAGAELCASLREGGFDGALTLAGEEDALPYQRPPLSKKYLLGEMAAERLWLRPRDFYDQARIDLRLGARAAAVDRAAREVRLADGSALPYDLLALTTGARPRLLPETIGGRLDGVYPVRTLADVDAMAPEFLPGRRALVVGGGYIGLEAAAVAAAKGLRVIVVEVAARILNRVAAPETADFFRDLHSSRGVAIREGVGLNFLEAVDGRVARAVLTDGAVTEVDFVLVGVGIVPNEELAAAAGLDIANGIAVDGRCRTSDPAIFAAGDCASFPWRGARVRLESVQNAIEQAQAAARAMLGGDAAYDPVPWFWSDQYDVKLQIAGLGAGADRAVRRPGARPGGMSVWCFRDGVFVAVDAMNDARAYMTGKRWLEAGVSPDPEAVADAGRDLRSAVGPAA